MPRQLQFLTLACATVLAASWAAILVAEPAQAAGQNRQAPRWNDSPQFPNTSDPKSGPQLRATPGEVSWGSVQQSHPRIPPESDLHISVIENTPIHVITNTPISTREARQGDNLSFTLIEDVIVSDVLTIPRGAAIRGTVVKSTAAGVLTGSPCLILKLTSLDLEGRTYPLYTYQFKVIGASKNKQTMNFVAGSTAVGGLMADYMRRNTIGETTSARKFAYVAKGTAIGAGTGLAVSAVAPGPVVVIPAESELDFSLALPTSVIPVSAEEAERLSKAMRPGGPMLYVRGETP